MAKITLNQLKEYFNTHKFSTYAIIAKEFNVCQELIRKKFKNEIISSLNFKSKYITYRNLCSFDSNGLAKINNFIFSEHRGIKSTVYNIIKSKDKISSEELYNLFDFNIRQQISQLIKTNKIFVKKKAKHSIYSVNPFNDKIIVNEKFDITSLRKNDKLLRDLQIIKEINEDKKIDIARKYDIDPKTINDIKQRFETRGAKGLIHSRKPEIKRISSSTQAAIIAEAVIHPEKSPNDIKKNIELPKEVPLKEVKKLVTETRKSIELKKKILLEIQ